MTKLDDTNDMSYIRLSYRASVQDLILDYNDLCPWELIE